MEVFVGTHIGGLIVFGDCNFVILCYCNQRLLFTDVFACVVLQCAKEGSVPQRLSACPH